MHFERHKIMYIFPDKKIIKRNMCAYRYPKHPFFIWPYVKMVYFIITAASIIMFKALTDKNNFQNKIIQTRR